MSLFDQLEHACLTDVGVRRSHNQDAYAIVLASDAEHWRRHGHVFLVADGMGGHAVGEKASAKAAADVPHTYLKHAHEPAAKAIRTAFVETNAGIHAIGHENREFKGLGTTGIGLFIRPEGAWLGHVGDSRAYRVRAGKIEQLSFDHSYVWELARRQRCRPEDIQNIRSNVIVRSLGPDAHVEVDIEGPYPLLPGDVFVLCSDGLSGPVADAEIGAVAGSLPPAEACRFLVDLANLRGGPDNITVLIVRVPLTADTGNPPPPQPNLFTRLGQWWQDRIPWPLTVMGIGMLLAIAAVALQIGQMPGAAVVFALAIVALGFGGYGLALIARRGPPPSFYDPTPDKLNVYRQANCKVERALIDKIVKGQDALQKRLAEMDIEPDRVAFARLHQQGLLALQEGDLPGSFREQCRALSVLARAYHQTRHKEEFFKPNWDRHSTNAESEE